MRRKAASAVFLVIGITLPLAAQSTTGSSSANATTQQPANGQGSTSSGQSTATGPQPVPYSNDEFPLWLREFRRAEVISIGAFPITLLFSSVGYQLYRYSANNFEPQYAPGIFGSTSTPLSSQESFGVVLGGIGLAVGIAVADFILTQLFPVSASQVAP